MGSARLFPILVFLRQASGKHEPTRGTIGEVQPWPLTSQDSGVSRLVPTSSNLSHTTSKYQRHSAEEHCWLRTSAKSDPCLAGAQWVAVTLRARWTRQKHEPN
jgi:hypothetical protein